MHVDGLTAPPTGGVCRGLLQLVFDLRNLLRQSLGCCISLERKSVFWTKMNFQIMEGCLLRSNLKFYFIQLCLKEANLVIRTSALGGKR